MSDSMPPGDCLLWFGDVLCKSCQFAGNAAGKRSFLDGDSGATVVVVTISLLPQ